MFAKESDLYVVHNGNETSYIIRKKDMATAFISDEHSNLLVRGNYNTNTFNKLCSAFTFMDIITEKQAIQCHNG